MNCVLFNREPITADVTTSFELTPSINMAATLISAAYHKQCDVDVSAQTANEQQLIKSLTNVILDENNLTCISWFESAQRQLQLQVMLRSPQPRHQLGVTLIGLNMNCHEPFTVVYNSLAKAVVKKQQCTFRGGMTLESTTGFTECHFECFTGTYEDSDVQVTMLFESHKWRVGNQPTAQLREMLFILKDGDIP